MRPIERAKKIILDETSRATPGQSIEILSGEESISIFRRALELIEVQRELNKRGIRVTLRVPRPAVDQAKEHILKTLRESPSEIRQIVFPSLPQDVADYRAALELPEVQEAFRVRNVLGIIQPTGKDPEIIIATYEDVTSGRLDGHFKAE